MPAAQTLTDVQSEVIRIVGADDQTAVRDGLVLMLDLLPDITVVASAANGSDALALAEKHLPDAMLVDLQMPVLDGIETTKRLTAEHPEIAIVVLTTYADDASAPSCQVTGRSEVVSQPLEPLNLACSKVAQL